MVRRRFTRASLRPGVDLGSWISDLSWASRALRDYTINVHYAIEDIKYWTDDDSVNASVSALEDSLRNEWYSSMNDLIEIIHEGLEDN